MSWTHAGSGSRLYTGSHRLEPDSDLSYTQKGRDRCWATGFVQMSEGPLSTNQTSCKLYLLIGWIEGTAPLKRDDQGKVRRESCLNWKGLALLEVLTVKKLCMFLSTHACTYGIWGNIHGFKYSTCLSWSEEVNKIINLSLCGLGCLSLGLILYLYVSCRELWGFKYLLTWHALKADKYIYVWHWAIGNPICWMVL